MLDTAGILPSLICYTTSTAQYTVETIILGLLWNENLVLTLEQVNKELGLVLLLQTKTFFKQNLNT